jgi:hypothetical protein
LKNPKSIHGSIWGCEKNTRRIISSKRIKRSSFRPCDSSLPTHPLRCTTGPRSMVSGNGEKADATE